MFVLNPIEMSFPDWLAERFAIVGAVAEVFAKLVLPCGPILIRPPFAEGSEL